MCEACEKLKAENAELKAAFDRLQQRHKESEQAFVTAIAAARGQEKGKTAGEINPHLFDRTAK